MSTSGGSERTREYGAEGSSQESNLGIFSPEVLVYDNMAARNESLGTTSRNTNGEDVFSQEAVMISECDGESYNTAATLHYCRRRILTPRDIILCLLGGIKA